MIIRLEIQDGHMYEKWTSVSPCSSDPVPAQLLVSTAAAALHLLHARGLVREDAPYANACALYVIRAGVLSRLDEAGGVLRTRTRPMLKSTNRVRAHT